MRPACLPIFAERRFCSQSIYLRMNGKWLALAQHHGLPTRLLDWSHSPIVALYFAAARGHESNCRLYGYDWGPVGTNIGIIEPSSQRSGPFKYDDDIARFALPEISKRMADQQAVFTIQGNPLEDIHVVAKAQLHCLDFATDDRAEILVDLFRLGISASALFRICLASRKPYVGFYEDYIPRMKASGST
jgi:hypothetical protein